jgi:hypothetical protein
MSATVYEYKGNLHIHSKFSDGTASVAEIVQMANEADLDFIGLNDHNSLQAKQLGLEGKYQRVNLLVGAEFGKKHNHYLAYNISKIVSNQKSSQQTIDEVNEQGGFGFLAHPLDRPTWFRPFSFPWRDWNVTNYCGICLWNFSTQWMEAYHRLYKGLRSQIRGIPEQIGPAPALLQLWDYLTLKCKLPVISGSDAHGIHILGNALSYQKLFRCVNIHILSDQPFTECFAENSRIIHTNLRNGHSFIGFDYFQDSQGFRFWGEAGNKIYRLGEEAVFHSPVALRINLPVKARIRLICNGALVQEHSGETLTYLTAEPGVYRVEAQLPVKGRMYPWIYSNPIYLRRNLQTQPPPAEAGGFFGRLEVG